MGISLLGDILFPFHLYGEIDTQGTVSISLYKLAPRNERGFRTEEPVRRWGPETQRVGKEVTDALRKICGATLEAQLYKYFAEEWVSPPRPKYQTPTWIGETQVADSHDWIMGERYVGNESVFVQGWTETVLDEENMTLSFIQHFVGGNLNLSPGDRLTLNKDSLVEALRAYDEAFRARMKASIDACLAAVAAV